jgi:serine kinase of HPr protein (carbohydrate metabolism regulator)
MRISELAPLLGLEVAQGEYSDRALSSGYASDLLSDVMANAKADGVLVTVQAHKNAIAVASLVGLAAIIVCNSRPMPEDMLEAAKAEGVALFRSAQSAFEISGRLWAALHRP